MREYFSDLFGNDRTRDRLGEDVEHGTLAHAHLIVGDSGSGKRTLAREIAAALNCEMLSDGAMPLPCGMCSSCKRIKNEQHPDVKYQRRADKATLGVDEIRLLREDMYLSPTESKYKVYIIEEADRMTPNAQNALLKVLEELPSGTVILLLCESPDKILTTIKSRAQLTRMQRFSDERLRELLLDIDSGARAMATADPEKLSGIITSAGGRLGRARELLSSRSAKEIAEAREATEKIISALDPREPYSALYLALSELPSQRAEFSEALEMLLSALRDLIAIKTARAPAMLFFTSRDEARRKASVIETKRLSRIFELVCEAERDVLRNVSVQTVLIDVGAKIKTI